MWKFPKVLSWQLLKEARTKTARAPAFEAFQEGRGGNVYNRPRLFSGSQARGWGALCLGKVERERPLPHPEVPIKRSFFQICT